MDLSGEASLWLLWVLCPSLSCAGHDQLQAQLVRLLLLPMPLASFPLASVGPILPSAPWVCLGLVLCNHLEGWLSTAGNAALAWWERGLGKNWLRCA